MSTHHILMSISSPVVNPIKPCPKLILASKSFALHQKTFLGHYLLRLRNEYPRYIQGASLLLSIGEIDAYVRLLPGPLLLSASSLPAMSSGDLEKKRSNDEKYGIETASTESLPSYEEAAVTTGAPVEKISPLGYHVDSLTVVFLVNTHITILPFCMLISPHQNVSKMIGTGVFSTRMSP